MPTPSDPTASLSNYSLSTTNGTLTVTKATLTITSNNKSRVYGAPNPMLTVTYRDSSMAMMSVLSGSPALSTTATVSSSRGRQPYSITACRAPSTVSYNFLFVAGVS